MDIVLISIVCGVAAVIYGIITSRAILSASPGNARMQEIAKAIQEGAMAYLKRQFKTIAVILVPLAIVAFALIGAVAAVTRYAAERTALRFLADMENHRLRRETIATAVKDAKDPFYEKCPMK